jgi:menaquinone-dependent protoporphyrinogen oxidase
MARVLIIYATVEGQAARVAARIALQLRNCGHSVATRRVDKSEPYTELTRQLGTFDAVIVGASIHYGKHSSYLRALLKRCRAELAARPSAFFSVSLSAGGPGAKPDAAQRYVNSFLRQVRWQPRQIATFAGALCYSKYGRFKRFLVVLFVRMAGGDTDTSHDYEYTDWKAVDRFAVDFAKHLPPVQHSDTEPKGAEAITSELA